MTTRMRPAAKRRNLQDPQQILEELESFLGAAVKPTLIEPGKPPIRLDPRRLKTSATANGVLLESWSQHGNIVRRLTSIVSRSGKKLELLSSRFGRTERRVRLIDAERLAPPNLGAGHSSAAFVARLLARGFPRARIARLTGAGDMRHGLSGRYVRCQMMEDKISWAVLAAPARSSMDTGAAALAAGLVWLDLLRSSQYDTPAAGLRILLPEGLESRTAMLLGNLDPQIASYELFVFGNAGAIRQVELRDAGNLELKLEPHWEPVGLGDPVRQWIQRLQSRVGVETVAQHDGARSIRIFGLEFASVRNRRMTYGLEQQIAVTDENIDEVVTFVQRLGEFRRPAASSHSHPLYAAQPERWLESVVRTRIGAVDATLDGSPIYTQTASVQGVDRGIIDLLAIDRAGRLAVLELKTTPSLQLPLQGLEYWAKVARTLATDLDRLRMLFPDHPVSPLPPRLLLIAPALSFHSKTEVLIQFFASSISVERVGLNSDWRAGINKRYHLRGPARADIGP